MVYGIVILLAVIDQPFWDAVSGRDIDQLLMVLADEGSPGAFGLTITDLAQLGRESRWPVGADRACQAS
jgi:hypothetical protein